MRHASLSTPSLGITKALDGKASLQEAGLSTPSLGITLDFAVTHTEPTDLSFQLPLSGSRLGDVKRLELKLEELKLSTPSLGITSRMVADFLVFLNETFNSLSRDH